MLSRRFLPLFSSCFLLGIFISTFVLAQSSRVPLSNELNRLPVTQPHRAMPHNISRAPQSALFTRGEAGATRRSFASPASPSPISGLNFAPAVTYNSDANHFSSYSVAVADVNGDGKPDLVMANACSADSCTNGTVSVLLGNGDGTFQTAVNYASGGILAYSVAVADVNEDGKPDLVVTNECGSGATCDGTVGVLLGNGDGAFQTAVTYSSGGWNAYTVAAADVNGDGKPDLVVASQCASSCNAGIGGGVVGVLLGNGDGTFQAPVTYGSGGLSTFWMVVADVNGDGKPDLVVANDCGSSATCGTDGTVGVLLGNGDGTFQTAVSYGSGGWGAYAVAAADVNGDGKPDLVVTNDCPTGDTYCGNGASVVGVLLGNGDGSFQPAVTYPSSGGSVSVAVADVNGDGKPDLLMANWNSSTVGVLLGNGDGTFQQAVAYASGGYEATFVAVGDVNGDGKPDLMVSNSCNSSNNCANGVVGVLINTSAEATITTLVSSPNPSNFGQAVTFTAAVTVRGSKGAPTGTVSFLDQSTAANLGTSTLNGSGVATLAVSSLAVGTSSITATYNGSANFASSTSSALSQLVHGAIVKLSPTSLSFGNQTVNLASAAKNVTLSNSGNAALNIRTIFLAGANVPSFRQTNNCGATLAAGGSCIIAVRFEPNSAASKTAAIGITDNAPNSSQYVPLSGTGVLPAVTFSPGSLAFATQVVYTTSAAKTVRLTNSGLGILEISKIAVSGPFAQTHTCGSTLNPGASCTFTVSFTPKAIGLLTGGLSVTDNATGSTQEVSLEGTGTAIQLAPTTLNFGNQPVNTASLAKTITLSNKSSAAVSITSITITGTNAGSFSQTHTCGATIASGASCFIKVTFKPTATGAWTAAVSVSDNGGGSPQKVSLSGTGT